MSLASEEAQDEAYTGGKGASLAQMISLRGLDDVKIPRGIVLTTKAFEAHIEDHLHLKEGILRLENSSNQLCSERNGVDKSLLQAARLQENCEWYVIFQHLEGGVEISGIFLIFLKEIHY